MARWTNRPQPVRARAQPSASPAGDPRADATLRSAAASQLAPCTSLSHPSAAALMWGSAAARTAQSIAGLSAAFFFSFLFLCALALPLCAVCTEEKWLSAMCVRRCRCTAAGGLSTRMCSACDVRAHTERGRELFAVCLLSPAPRATAAAACYWGVQRSAGLLSRICAHFHAAFTTSRVCAVSAAAAHMHSHARLRLSLAPRQTSLCPLLSLPSLSLSKAQTSPDSPVESCRCSVAVTSHGALRRADRETC